RAEHPDTSVRRLDVNFLRRATAAFEEYDIGRRALLRYIAGIRNNKHNLGAYLSALTHFELCVGCFWQAAELYDQIEKKVLGTKPTKLTLYKYGDRSDLERINMLYNISKHFSAEQAEQTSTPIWITNVG